MTYTWTDNAMQSGTACNVDTVNENLMYLKYDSSGYPLGYHGSAPPVASTTAGAGSGTLTVSSSGTTATFSTSQTGLIGAFITTLGGQTRVVTAGSGTSWTVTPAWTTTESAVSWTQSITTGLSMANIHERDSTNAVDIDYNSSSTLVLNTTGLNALDTGTVAANTFYYLYVVTNGTNVGLMVSTVNEFVTGSISNAHYAYTYKRQLPFWVLTNAGALGIIPFSVGQGWPYTPLIKYIGNNTYYNGSSYIAGTTANVLANGTASSFTAVSLSSYMPPISTTAFIQATTSSATNLVFTLRPTGSGLISNVPIGSGASTAISGQYWVDTNSSQSIDYKKVTGTGNLNLDFLGCVVNVGI